MWSTSATSIFLDQPFTSKINLLQGALEKYETRGGTALYDAVVASADELKKTWQTAEENPVCRDRRRRRRQPRIAGAGSPQVAGREWPHGVRHRTAGRGKAKARQARPAKPFLSAPEASLFPPHPGRSRRHQQHGGPRHPQPVHHRLQTHHTQVRGRISHHPGRRPRFRTRQAHGKDPQRLLRRPGTSRRRRKLREAVSCQLSVIQPGIQLIPTSMSISLKLRADAESCLPN